MSLPSLHQLQYLLAVVELRRFGRTAERCFVAQSTLSAGIQALESLLDCQWLERLDAGAVVAGAALSYRRDAERDFME